MLRDSFKTSILETEDKDFELICIDENSVDIDIGYQLTTGSMFKYFNIDRQKIYYFLSVTVVYTCYLQGIDLGMTSPF